MYNAIRLFSIIVMSAGALWAFVGVFSVGLVGDRYGCDVMWDGLTLVCVGAIGLIVAQSIWDRV